MRKGGSLYLRLMFTALVPMALASACAFLIALTVFTRTLDDRVREQTEHAAQVLAGADLPLTAPLLRRLSALQRADFFVLGPDGRVILSSTRPVSARLLHSLGTVTEDRRMARLTLDGTPVVAALARLEGSDPRYRDLIAVSSLSDARAAARRAALALAGAVTLAAALLAVLIHLLTNQITRPLAALANLAASIGSGRRGLQVPVERNDELGELARALNEMVGRIERYESQLADRSRLSALGEMAARLAHEIRNPLTGLKMHLQLLAERLPSVETARIGLLLNEVRRLELVVDASLMLARDRKPELVASDLGAVAVEVIELMRPSLAHRHIQVACRLEPVPPVLLDRALIKQALLNLLTNAADALPEGGQVDVSTSGDAAHGRALLTVEDSGKGFAPAMAASEARRAASGKPFGLGLGLAICREVAELHGGDLTLGVSRLGGARLALQLPLRLAQQGTGEDRETARCEAV